MKSMTYGNLPSKSAIAKALGGAAYQYEMKGSMAETCERVGVPQSGEFDVDELYGILQKLVEAFENGDDEAGQFASDILYTLDFEWI